MASYFLHGHLALLLVLPVNLLPVPPLVQVLLFLVGGLDFYDIVFHVLENIEGGRILVDRELEKVIGILLVQLFKFLDGLYIGLEIPDSPAGHFNVAEFVLSDGRVFLIIGLLFSCLLGGYPGLERDPEEYSRSPEQQ